MTPTTNTYPSRGLGGGVDPAPSFINAAATNTECAGDRACLLPLPRPQRCVDAAPIPASASDNSDSGAGAFLEAV